MLALESKAQITGHSAGVRLAKIAGLQEFASGNYAVEHMLLDLRQPQVARHGHDLTQLPWAGFVVRPDSAGIDGRHCVRLLDDPAIAKPGDVVELQPERAKLAIRYRRGSNGNVLFATERCNSFCLMCSQPPRPIMDDWRTEQLCQLVSLIDRNEVSLAISGGEPTLLGNGLLQVVRRCAECLPDTHIHILSNGRRFGQDFAATPFSGLHPSISWGVPLYGDSASLHDYVVQSRGAFAQTLRGLYALHDASQRLEIRVVLVRPVVERLPEIARFIYRNVPFVEHIAFMGVEPIGLALANHDALWIDPADAAPVLAEAVDGLAKRGMTVSLYNLPLCTMPATLWPFAKRSISDWKQDYLDECGRCSVQDKCSGVFSWKSAGWRSRAIAAIEEEHSNA